MREGIRTVLTATYSLSFKGTLCDSHSLTSLVRKQFEKGTHLTLAGSGSLRPLPTENHFQIILDHGVFELLFGMTDIPPEAPFVFTVEHGKVTGCVVVLLEPNMPPVFIKK